MELAELMAQGKAELTERRAAEAAKKQAAEERQAAEQTEFERNVSEGIRALVPEAVWPYIDIPDMHIGQWSVVFTINVPGCAPVKAKYLTDSKTFNDHSEPYWACRACEGGYYDWGEPYPPYYAELGDTARTAGEALALAAEQHEAMKEYEIAYGKLLAEHEVKQAEEKAKREAEAQAAPFPITPQPTTAERLESLIREIVDEQLAAGFSADYD